MDFKNLFRKSKNSSISTKYDNVLIRSSQQFHSICDQMNNILLPPIPFDSRIKTLEKYQMAIYELFNVEIDIYLNISKIIHIYKNPMLAYQLITEQESEILFSNLELLAKIHFNLITRLELTRKDHLFCSPVNALMDFFNSMNQYEVYCINLSKSKKLLEKKMKEKPFADFLNSEYIQKYSKKLDLSFYLDQPRKQLMKYPILLEEIFRQTPNEEKNNQLMVLQNEFAAFNNKINVMIDIKEYQEFLDKFEFPKKQSIIKNNIKITCTKILLVTEVETKKFPNTWLILLDNMLILAVYSELNDKFRIMESIECGGTLYYQLQQRSTPKEWNPFKKNRFWHFSFNKQRRWLHLFGKYETDNAVDFQSFDVTVKFPDQDDLETWVWKLNSSFNLIQLESE